MKKYVKAAKNHPQFISKYQGRHNNGIPCFSEERSMERQKKVGFIREVQIQGGVPILP